MPVTLATYALVTENEYKEQGSGIDASDPTQDETIRFCINSASERIMEYASREFKDLTGYNGLGATRKFQIVSNAGCYFDDVSFGPYDAQSISAVVIDTQLGQTGLTLTTTQYQPVPVQKWDGVYTGLHVLTGATGYVATGSRREATVTGTWGWPSVPARIKHACVETVKDWLAGEYQVPGGDVPAAMMATQLQLPGRVRAMLDEVSPVLIA